MKIAVLVTGGGTNLQAIMDSIKSGAITNTSLEVVIANKKDAYALERAKNNGIPNVYLSPKDFEDRDAYGKKLIETIESYEADLVVLAGCLVILPGMFVKHFEHRIINIHPSLIPSFCGGGYYGLRVHKEVLARGCKVTGATVHFVDDGTDTGPILLQKAVEVQQGDTPEILQKRVMEQAEWKILPKAIDLIANGKVKIVDNLATIVD